MPGLLLLPGLRRVTGYQTQVRNQLHDSVFA